jgi:NADPH-dependent stearoyl-CoA 9-desaturase
MAIAEVSQYAHLSDADIEALAAELDTIRRDIEDSRGAKDREHIRRAIVIQRCLEIAARLTIGLSKTRSGWMLGTATLAVAKCVENMELAHNITHGQWDWMNDPEIHSSTWEWDMVGPSSHWMSSHNHRHHMFTNIIGLDDDLGFGVLRVTREQEWRPSNLLQPLRAVVLAAAFEWGVAFHDLYSIQERETTEAGKDAHKKTMLRKMGRQVVKDYVLFPALSHRRWRRVLGANVVANGFRNAWAYIVIVCGHFADGAEKFDPSVLQDETKPLWYLRQMLGTGNFEAGRVLSFMTGHLCYQIEHHLFPDLPSNRLPEIAERVRALCVKYDLPYTTGSFLRQYLLTVRTICKLALPVRFMTATCDDAPETASENKFRYAQDRTQPSVTCDEVRRSGLATAIVTHENRRRAG